LAARMIQYIRSYTTDRRRRPLQGIRVAGGCTCNDGRTECAPTAFYFLCSDFWKGRRPFSSISALYMQTTNGRPYMVSGLQVDVRVMTGARNVPLLLSTFW